MQREYFVAGTFCLLSYNLKLQIIFPLFKQKWSYNVVVSLRLSILALLVTAMVCHADLAAAQTPNFSIKASQKVSMSCDVP